MGDATKAQTGAPGAWDWKPLLGLVALLVLGVVFWAAVFAPSLAVDAVSSALLRLYRDAGVSAFALHCVAFGVGSFVLFMLTRRRDDTTNNLSFKVAAGMALLIWFVLAIGASGLFVALPGAWPRYIAFAAIIVLSMIAAVVAKPRAAPGGASTAARKNPPWWSPFDASSLREQADAATDNFARVVLAGAWLIAGGWLAFACSMPGVLWPSEFGGYDSLSYHLPLAQEWLAKGRVWPSEQNVYSYLPSGLEGLFALQAMVPVRSSFLADGGKAMIGAQVLHAFMGIVAAFAVGSLARRIAQGLGVPNARARLAGATAALLVLATPWSIVVGTLSYNEMGLVLMFAACGTAMLTLRHKPGALGAVVGLLVGGACAIKPTAIFMIGVPMGVWIMLALRGRALAVAIATGILSGCIMLAPWMIRNWVASGNPVFPFGASLFARGDGSMGHWSAEQIARYAAAHRFDGSLAERLRLMVLPDPKDPMGSTHRGLRHPQWGEMLMIVMGVCAIALVASQRWLRAAASVHQTRNADAATAVDAPVDAALDANRALLALALALPLQAVLWLFTTHVQSRFLLPCIVPAAVLLALFVSGCLRVRPRRNLDAAALQTRAIALLGAVLLAMWYRAPSAMTRPQVPLTQGIAMTLETIVPNISPGASFSPQAPPAGPEAIVAALPAGSKVLLLGDATPLYFPADRIVATTTWDTSPYVQAGSLQGLQAMGYTHALINFAELDRLQRSKFLDPRIDVQALVKQVQQGPAPIAMWQRGAQVLVSLKR